MILVRSFLIIVVLVVVCFGDAVAQVSTADQDRALRKLDKERQKQENLIKYLGREYERKERERKKQQVEIPELEIDEGEDGQCFEVRSIELEGSDLLSDKEKAAFVEDYLGSCMTIADINQVMRQLTNYYVESGYITTRVLIPQQDLKDGSLELVVVEGKIEKIILNGNGWRDVLQARTAFGLIEGEVLNLRDIEQGLDQLNRLLSSNATMEIEPGSKNGYSKIVVTNKHNKMTRFKIGFDNAGLGTTGKNKQSVSFERDNLFGLGEYLNVSFNKDVADDGGEQGSEVISGMLSLPFGYLTLTGSVSHSEYRVTSYTTNQSFSSSGETDSGTVGINRVVHRDQNSKTSVGAGFAYKNTIAFNQGAELDTGTRALSILDVNADHTHRIWGSILYGAVAYKRGLDVFGARDDVDGLTFSEQRAQFDKFTLDASVYRPFTLRQQKMAYRLYASGQYSSDPLFASERISIGDRYTVRGFQADSIEGDSGGYVRNEVMWSLPKLVENKYVDAVVGVVQPYVGLDFGMARVRGGKLAGNPIGEGYLSGWAVGLRNEAEWMNFDVAYSRAIKQPGFMEGDDELYFSVGSELGF